MQAMMQELGDQQDEDTRVIVRLTMDAMDMARELGRLGRDLQAAERERLICNAAYLTIRAGLQHLLADQARQNVPALRQRIQQLTSEGVYQDVVRLVDAELAAAAAAAAEAE
jgi:hypothetical protein